MLGYRIRGFQVRGERPFGTTEKPVSREALFDQSPPPRTKWTRRVPHPVLIGHAAGALAPQAMEEAELALELAASQRGTASAGAPAGDVRPPPLSSY
jgi:hypothetical protein